MYSKNLHVPTRHVTVINVIALSQMGQAYIGVTIFGVQADLVSLFGSAIDPLNLNRLLDVKTCQIL